MSIVFNSVSQNSRASKIFIELAGKRRSLASLFIPPTIGLLGQYNTGKTPTDYEPQKVVSAEDVGNKAGFGSHAHRMALAMPPEVFLQGGGVYWFPIPEAGGAEKAEKEIGIAGAAATSAGTLYWSIGGILVSVNVAVDDTAEDICDNLVDEITAIRDIPITAVKSSGAVTASAPITLTVKNGGTVGNELLAFQNPAGDVQEEKAPGGITITDGSGYFTGGTGDADIHDAFFNASEEDVLGNRWYTIFNMPYQDSTNLGVLKTALEGREDPSIGKLCGAYLGFVNKTYAEALALPEDVNSKYIGEIWDDRCLAPSWELSAAKIGRIAYEQNIQPARPYKTTKIGLLFKIGIADRNWTQNDALFRAGMSYCSVDSSGEATFGDLALTYRKTAQDADTEEWFDAVSLHCRQAKAYSIDQVFLSEPYTRGVVVDNDSISDADYAISPNDVIADLAKLVYDLWARYAWTKNAEAVIAGIKAEINSSNNGRIDAEDIDDEAKALRIIAIKHSYLY